MYKYGKVLIQKFFEEQSFVDSNIDSFNNFVDSELNQIVEENRDIAPTIIPHNVDTYKIRLDKIWVKKPEIIEADGSTKDIYPIEARLRKITYSSPVFIEISAHINEVQRESSVIQVCNLPIMLKSKHCQLYKLPREELIKRGEDPDDPSGYFIINGTEKVLI
ncbi:MAG: DNA-directed RNA polymerase subunit B'', partial [Nanoarchaeota archaeon]